MSDNDGGGGGVPASNAAANAEEQQRTSQDSEQPALQPVTNEARADAQAEETSKQADDMHMDSAAQAAVPEPRPAEPAAAPAASPPPAHDAEQHDAKPHDMSHADPPAASASAAIATPPTTPIVNTPAPSTAPSAAPSSSATTAPAAAAQASSSDADDNAKMAAASNYQPVALVSHLSSGGPGEHEMEELPGTGGHNDVVATPSTALTGVGINMPNDERDLKEPQHFPIHSFDLQELVDPKSLKRLQEMGGLRQIAEKLNVDLVNGLKSTELDGITAADGTVQNVKFGKRIEQYGKNVLPDVRSEPFYMLVWGALQDKTLIILMIAAAISIAIGIYEGVSAKQAYDAAVAAGSSPPPPELGHWVEGVAILVAVVVVVLVNSINDYQKEKQFRKLNAKKEDRLVKVIRDGAQCQISVYDIVVGDVCLVEYGDIISVDGLFIDGHDIKCDESGTTGESDAIKKGHDSDPFLLSGTKVLEGSGRMLTIAVGEKSFYGKTMMAMRTGSEDTPLQMKLEILAENIGKLGLSAAVLMLVILILKYCITNATSGNPWPPASTIVSDIIGFFIVAITIVVVAVPEGLPMAVTLALAYATIQMLKDQNLVRVLAACETMAICSDKTGTLTQNKMTVVKGSIAYRQFESDTEVTDFNGTLPQNVRNLVIEGITVNSAASEGKDDTDRIVFSGSKTEVALIMFIKKLASDTMVGADYLRIRKNTHVEKLIPFSSERKRMSTIVQSTSAGSYVLYCKGASEIVLALCSNYLNDKGETKPLDDTIRTELEQRIVSYATDGLRTICLAYLPLKLTSAEMAFFELNESTEKDLTFLGVVGIQDPVRPEVPEAVATCQRAGIRVRMVTGDNIVTARNIARTCGILSKGGIIMEGPEFRRLSPEQMDRIVPNLEVLARSSPKDKQLLVSRLQERGETVAVTGDGTNDGPALKLADVGFAMGIAGTEVAKEASDIILMDDNFASIVKAVMWGRSVFDSVRKFLQFQLTVNLCAVIVAFFTAITDTMNQSVLTAVQLLWVNLIMDTMAALALATEPPTLELLNRKPHGKSEPLISYHMWRMVIGQAAFQIAISFMLFYDNGHMFGLDPTTVDGRAILRTMVFNVFVFLQVFNELNCRVIDNHLNIFIRLHRHKSFLIIMFITIAVQILVVEVGGEAFQTTGLNWWQWLVCVGIGALGLPLGIIVRLIPDWRKPAPPEMESTVTREKLLWENAISDVRKQIRVIHALRRERRNF